MRRSTLLLILFLTACSSIQQPVMQPGVSDRLFCGLSIPGGGEVSEQEWRGFVREEVTPRLPEGFTMWRAEGYWRDRTGAPVTETVLVIEVVHRYDARVDDHLLQIAEAWKRRFRQDAVLRVVGPARMQFIN
ncbi:MAG TPA: DUF3574 domain-containing protein [Thermoanaerobaculia bacterium]|jgi:hypothetical protein